MWWNKKINDLKIRDNSFSFHIGGGGGGGWCRTAIATTTTTTITATTNNNFNSSEPTEFKGECSVFLIYFIMDENDSLSENNKDPTVLVTIVPMVPFTIKSTSKLRSALHIRYSIVIPRFIFRAITAQS